MKKYHIITKDCKEMNEEVDVIKTIESLYLCRNENGVLRLILHKDLFDIPQELGKSKINLQVYKDDIKHLTKKIDECNDLIDVNNNTLKIIKNNNSLYINTKGLFVLKKIEYKPFRCDYSLNVIERYNTYFIDEEKFTYTYFDRLGEELFINGIIFEEYTQVINYVKEKVKHENETLKSYIIHYKSQIDDNKRMIENYK